MEILLVFQTGRFTMDKIYIQIYTYMYTSSHKGSIIEKGVGHFFKQQQIIDRQKLFWASSNKILLPRLHSLVYSGLWLSLPIHLVPLFTIFSPQQLSFSHFQCLSHPDLPTPSDPCLTVLYPLWSPIVLT